MEKNALTIASFPSNVLDPVAPTLRLVEDARWYSGRDMIRVFFPCLIKYSKPGEVREGLALSYNCSSLDPQ